MSVRSLFGSFLAFSSTQDANVQSHETSKCGQFSHPDFCIQVSNKAIPHVDVQWFLQYLEKCVSNGDRFKAGETMRVGWMLIRFQDGQDGTLRITEPDMKTVPIRFVESANSTLMHLRSQKDTVESIDADLVPAFPSLEQSVVVHRNYKKTNRVLLSRAASEGMDSGWWLSDLNDPHGNQEAANFLKISLYQLGLDRPDLIKFFALPEGLQAVVDLRIGVLREGVELPQKPGSFLDLLNRKQG